MPKITPTEQQQQITSAQGARAPRLHAGFARRAQLTHHATTTAQGFPRRDVRVAVSHSRSPGHAEAVHTGEIQ